MITMLVSVSLSVAVLLTPLLLLLLFILQVEDVHLVRDDDTGQSKGFAFLKYEDARSCVLAVDNLIGTKVRTREEGKPVVLLLGPYFFTHTMF